MNYEEIKANRIAVRDAIIKHGPDHFNMSKWIYWEESSYGLADFNDPASRERWSPELVDFDINDCGAAACMAGHAAILNSEIKSANAAAKWLYVGEQIFYKNEWPIHYKEMGEYQGALAILDWLIDHPTEMDI